MIMTTISIGSTHNNFTVLSILTKKASNGQPYYQCKCVCGTRREVRKDNLGKVKGCGCIRSTYKSRTITKSKNKKTKKQTSATIRLITKAINKETAAKVKNEPEYQYNPMARQRIEDLRIKKELEKQFAL
jgi:hypothetical protein